LEYGIWQVVVQAIAFAVGLLIIRLISKQEYALYTLGGSVSGAVSVLSDLGLSAALLTVAGSNVKSPSERDAAVRMAHWLHTRFAIGGVALGAVGGSWLLSTHGASLSLSLAISVVASIAGIASSRCALGAALPRLDSQLRSLQKIDFATALARAVFMAAMLILIPSALAALAANVSALLLQRRLLSQLYRGRDGGGHEQDRRRELLLFVARQAPANFLYLAQGQLTLWLMALFGTSAAIAEYGALGRLAMALAIITSILNTMAIPYFARTHGRDQLITGYLLIVTFLFSMVVLGVVIAVLFPVHALWILGNRYAGLEPQLVAIVASTMLSTAATCLYGVNAAKGWIFPAWVLYGVWVMGVAAGLRLFDVSTVLGAAGFNAVNMAVSILASVGLFTYQVRRLSRPPV
jgi:O-antigen/teichoic acid export membrane protein